MFALRRVAVRALQFQPARQLSKPIQSRSAFQVQKTSFTRAFHQSRLWLAEEEQKTESPAEAEGGEAVTTEPSAEEHEAGIKEESIATPDVADAAQESSPPPAAESAAQEVTEEVKNATETAKQSVSTAASALSNTAASATGFAQPGHLFPGDGGATAIGQPTKILYVGNLFFEVTTAQLEAEFGRFGRIANSRIVTDPRGMSRGFGYIEFGTQEEADEALRSLDQKVFQGRRMAVQYHIRREARSSGNMRVDRRSRPVASPSKTLFIGNMSYQMSDRDLNGKGA